MATNKNNDAYVKQAIKDFDEIMTNSHKRMFDNLNKENKGEMFVLHFLFRQKKAVLPSKLSEAMDATTARISALLNALEKKEEIERNIDVNNRRNVLVTITDKGRKRIVKEMAGKKKVMSEVFNEMGEKDTKEFVRLTKEFAALLNKYFDNKL